MKNTTILFVMISCWSATTCRGSTADAVVLQHATATFSQTDFGDFSVVRAIDGIVDDGLGWAIFPQIGPQTAVFETMSDAGFVRSSGIIFTLVHSYPNHTLGRFRLSVTTDHRDSFADGLATDGDVTANWVVLEPLSLTSAGGATLTKLADHSILASGSFPATDVYTVTASTMLTNITGFRLEALTDPSLPKGGPGREPSNGNFHLTEFGVSIVPELARLSIEVSEVRLCWKSATNTTYQVQYRSDLTGSAWIDLGAPIFGNGTTNCVTNAVAGAGRFYRVAVR